MWKTHFAPNGCTLLYLAEDEKSYEVAGPIFNMDDALSKNTSTELYKETFGTKLERKVLSGQFGLKTGSGTVSCSCDLGQIGDMRNNPDLNHSLNICYFPQWQPKTLL